MCAASTFEITVLECECYLDLDCTVFDRPDRPEVASPFLGWGSLRFFALEGITLLGAIIQARMGSTRLPGKVLADLGDGTTVLECVIRRVAAVPSIGQVIVATSKEPQDDEIERRCEGWGIPCFRGDERDVLDRFFRAAALSGLSAVVRITADCPLLDPTVVERVVGEFIHSGADYVSNVHPPTFPDGLDCEVVRVDALQVAWDEASDPFCREHVLPYIWTQPERFTQVNVESTGNYAHLRWTLDTAEDLEHIRRLWARRQTDYRLLLDAD